MDRAAGVEIAQDAIPTPAWTAHKTRRPQRPTGRLAFTTDDETHKMTRYLKHKGGLFDTNCHRRFAPMSGRLYRDADHDVRIR